MHLEVQTLWSCILSCALLTSKVITIILTHLLLQSNVVETYETDQKDVLTFTSVL